MKKHPLENLLKVRHPIKFPILGRPKTVNPRKKWYKFKQDKTWK